LPQDLDADGYQTTPEVTTEPDENEQRIVNNNTVTIRGITQAQYQFLQKQPLSKREIEILGMIVWGNTQQLNITYGTVKCHIKHIFKKLNVRDYTQAAVFALRAGLVN